MKLSMSVAYSGGFKESAQRVVQLEKVGVDMVWLAEAYSFDAISQVGYLAAVTERIELATGILNVYSRTPTLMAMTAAGCDYVSDGRFVLGLGASGPQVIEGFHGVPYVSPMVRIKETIQVCREVWKREKPLEFHGKTVDIPLTNGVSGVAKPLKIINHPIRPRIPIWWAALKGKSVEATAELADGWLPIMFLPEKANNVWGEQLKAGLAKRDPSLGTLQISAGGALYIDDNMDDEAQAKMLDHNRDHMALYVGGMGARGKNFYNDIAVAYGYEKEAKEIQDLYLDGKKKEAAALIPADWIRDSNLIGTSAFVRDRLQVLKSAGVNVLNINPVGPDPIGQLEKLRGIADSI